MTTHPQGTTSVPPSASPHQAEHLEFPVEEPPPDAQATTPPPKPDRTRIEDWFRHWAEPDELYEFRIPNSRSDGPRQFRGTVSGHFTTRDDASIAALGRALGSITGADAEAVYATLNPVKPALRARSDHRLEIRAKYTTTDALIVKRRRILIDVDPIRPPGIAATDEEVAAALQVRGAVRDFLTSYGWPAPLYSGMSGSGGMLVYNVDEPNDDPTTALVQAVLSALAQAFDDAAVKIDQSVYNAARVTKVPGTIGAKGNHTPDLGRVWREATATFHADVAVVPREQLEAVAALAPAPAAPPKPTSTYTGAGYTPDDVQAALERHGIGYTLRQKPWAAVFYELDQCPTSTEHTKGATIGQFSSGAWYSRCLHDSCKGKRWADVRAVLGLTAAPSEPPPPNGQATASGGEQPFTLYTTHDVMGPLEPVEFVIDRLIVRPSLTLVVGAPGSKKTYCLLDAAVCLTQGKPWLGRATKPARVLFIDEESGKRRFTRRLKAVQSGHDAPADPPIYWTSLEGFNLRDDMAFARLIALMELVRPDVVFCDALADLMPGGDENSVKDTQPVFMRLRRLAETYNCAIVVIHHSNKAGDSRGSTAIKGAVNLLLMIESKPDSPNIDFETEKTQDIESTRFAAAFHYLLDGQGQIAQAHLSPTGTVVKRAKLSQGQRVVLEYLRDHGTATVKAIVEHAEASKECSPTTARAAVYALRDNAYLTRCDGGGQGSTAQYTLTTKGVNAATSGNL